MSSEKAFLQTENGDRLPCLFNPAQLSVSRSNRWEAEKMPGKGVPRLSYKGAESGSMSLELMFDTTDTGDPVTRYTDKLLKIMEVDPSLPGSDEQSLNVRPPYVTFHWGDLHSFKAVITSLSLQFVYFAGTGTPLRARVSLTLTQYEPAHAYGPQNPTSGTPRPHRMHRVQPGESLDRIAAQYYGDPTRWRPLAAANGIEDPMSVKPGTALAIPRLDQ